MISDKELFSIMLKYHPAIIGRLIQNDKCEKTVSGIVSVERSTKVQENQAAEDGDTFHFQGAKKDNIISLYKHSSDIQRLGVFLEVRTDSPGIFKHFDVSIYRSLWDKDCRYFCPPSLLNEILTNYSESISYIDLPQGLIVPANLNFKYLSILKRQISEILENKKEIYFSGFESFKYYGFGRIKNRYEYIEKCGVFAYTPIYSECEWSFEMVEQNKDQLLWLELMRNTRLLWTEEMLTKYDSYIPHKELTSYGQTSEISSHYLEAHKESINWRAFIRSANYKWNSDEIRKYYSRLDVSWSWLLGENRHFAWTPDTFKTMLELEPYALSRCINNNNLLNILYQIPHYEKIVNDIDSDFWHKLKDGGKRPHNSYSDYFTIENIEKNRTEWNKKLDDKFEYMIRRPDTNYHYHRIYTMWDYFIDNDNIQLDYDLCKYLKGITAIIGGKYVLEDGTYLSDSNTFQEHNGLDLFSDKKFINTDELEKVICDIELLDVFMNGKNEHHPNPYVLDYLIELFFHDYEVEKYLSLINRMNDWDDIVS